MIFQEYRKPQQVGWKGWVENANGTVIAFVRLNGEIVTLW